ncbi:putative spermidine/putrescine transport system ATP-binding protein [Gemmobacter aquatilis]|uniref:Putative spermidine/putrescine transport system ATP-binding protein n=2 Tax=Gemmobacter aquatilis TaxID=933059 RepID=A0A1H7YCZ4_9RHOB|nr:putative spermidine/putrescine transport system ATP-binding protein [Gemmobacter aquatilis]
MGVTLPTDTHMTAAVEFRAVSRHFGPPSAPVRAVDGVELTIAEGSFFAMLGPSGSGKTTCLRLISGFEKPTSGTIRIFGQDVSDVPPNRRNVNTVFQDYALFPHMNVRDNVAYGLMVKGVDRRLRHDKAEEMLALVKLGGYGDRKPGQLSGGQRQRVALARALVNEPRVLLLDEPLGALDLKLREAMQDELKALQQRLGITFVFVTHDQGEALSMADSLAVFNEGKIAQIGTPEEIYARPRTRFVADFVGSSNVLPPEVTRAFGGPAAWASLRPEALHLVAADGVALSGTVTGSRYLGAGSRVTVAVPGAEIAVIVPAGAPLPAPGSAIGLAFAPDALHVMEGA